MRILFWAVDCQKDFLNKDGALYVEGAEGIKPNLKKLTSMAINYGITVVNTMDWHKEGDEELSEEPDFVTTFPNHCMRNTKGVEFIKETMPVHDKNIIIKKNKFDVFTGNVDTEDIVKDLSPDLIFVYGVSGDYCVDYAVKGLVKRNYKVTVVVDAIQSINKTPIEEWDKLGVTTISTIGLSNLLSKSINES